MVSKTVFVIIAIAGVFFVGVTGSYAIFSYTDNPNMMPQNSQEFSQMMVQNPQMMNQWMGTMMQDASLRQQMMQEMMQNNQFMQEMMQRNKDDSMNDMTEKMRFNPNAPITMPLVDGYYDGTRVYFIHTEVSDPQMASMMTSMVNFPTQYVPNLKDISEKTGKVYVFTNGVPGMGPYGGGPFMFQIDIFDSVPGKDNYGQFRVPHLVSWNKDADPRVLTSEKELLEAQAKGELGIEPTDKIVNAPMVVWLENEREVTATTIEKIFTSLDDATADVVNVDTDLYTITLKMRSGN